MAKQSVVPKKDPLPKARDFRKRLERILPDEAERLELLESLGNPLKKSLRVLRLNPLRKLSDFERVELLREVPADTLEACPDWLKDAWIVGPEAVRLLDSHPLMGAGALFVQEAGASEVVGALDLRPGEIVLDMCAAPGAKSTQIAETLGGNGWLVANEPDTRRAKKLDALLARHGASNVTVYATSGERLSSLLDLRFDAILIDAPCSGESLFFKRFETRDDVRDSEVRRCAQIQAALLEEADALVRPGGRLLYSTCTYTRDENEDRVEEFLSKHSEWTLVRSQRRWPHKDGVAGGYWALLKKTGEIADALPLPELSNFDVKHLVRHGLKTWEGERDDYAAAMSASAGDSERPRFILENESQLKAYLRGESVSCDDDGQGSRECDVYWKERCVGIGKRVPGRLNNALPKTLKAGA